MSEPAPRATNDEAARWAVRLERTPLSPEEQRELDAWLAAAPSHRGALIRAQAVWLNLDRLGAVAGPTRGLPHADPLSGESADAAARPDSPPVYRRRWLMTALAASLAAVAVLSYRALTSGRQAYETDVGEVRRITLEDGSGITLNSGSRVSLRYDKDLRAVRLERGEALFEVAKNRARPFVVWSGDVSVRAVGTAFAVRVWPDTVSVTVTEGVVEVARPDAPPQRVTANERATVGPQRPFHVTPGDRSATDRQLAWRDGMVSFSGESLADAVREVNRYSRRKIEIDDPSLAAKPVVGIFRVGDVDAFAQAAAVALGAEVHAEDGVVRLAAAPRS